VDCSKLVATAVKYMYTQFMNICDSLEGQIGALEIDESYVPDSKGVPIDLLVVDLTKDTEGDGDSDGDDEDLG
jgi:hypothetical protein